MKTSILLAFLLLVPYVFGLSSRSVKHLEPVLGVTLVGEEEENEETKRKREEEALQPFPDKMHLSFSAFSKDFSFSLQVQRQITEGASLVAYGENDEVIERRPVKARAYKAVMKREDGEEEEKGWFSLTLNPDRTFHGLLFDGESLLIFDPLHNHDRDLTTSAKRDLESMSNMVVHRESDRVAQEEGLCGAVNSMKVTKEESLGEVEKRSTSSSSSQNATFTPSQNFGRGLKAVSRWTNCYPNDNVARKFTVGFYVDYGFSSVYSNNLANIEAAVVGILTDSNVIYYTQMNVFLALGELTIRTASNGDSFNQKRPCSFSINQDLDAFTAWRANRNVAGHGLFHLLTDCFPPPGTVGLAWVGVLCYIPNGTGVSTYSSSTWKTVAHEIGHNFGANHAFQEGQGSTGGIMDYGDGLLNGEYQFHTTYNKAEVCAEISSSMSASGSNYVSGCWASYAPECGNGLVEEGEECDDNSACCSSCKFASGAVCSGGECCDSCQFSLTSKNCGTQGYCSKGTCVQSICARYSNVAFCSTQASNRCQQTCNYEGGAECYTLNSFGLDGAVADGSICSNSPFSVCVSGSCVEASNIAWYTSAWGPCSAPCDSATRTRTVECRNSGVKVSDSLCTGTKPASSQACSVPTCSSLTFVWETISNGCDADCGQTGTETFQIYCAIEGGDTVSDSYCNPSTKPASSATCNGFCDATSWLIGPWGTCSASCGEGTQTRTVTCNSSPETVCSDVSPKPDTTKACQGPPCAPTWVISPNEWEDCSNTCGAGVQYKVVECYDGDTLLEDSACTDPKPVESRPCLLAPCPGTTYPLWVASNEEYGACDAKCDETGTQYLIYHCVEEDGSRVSEKNCPGDMPQLVSKTCIGPCGTSSAILGIAVGAAVGGAVLLLVIAAVLVFFFVYKKREPYGGGGKGKGRTLATGSTQQLTPQTGGSSNPLFQQNSFSDPAPSSPPYAAPYSPPAPTPAPYAAPRSTPAPYAAPKPTPAPYAAPKPTPAPYTPPKPAAVPPKPSAVPPKPGGYPPRPPGLPPKPY